MDKLPFLVAHGALVAKLVVVAFAVLGVWLGLAVRRGRDRKDANSLADVMAAGVVALAERSLTVRGTLVGSATTLTENMRGGEAPRTERSDDLAIRVDGEAEPIAIVGDAVVLRGTSVAVAWSGVPAGTPSRLAAGATGLGRRLFRLVPGDVVLASGVAAKRPDGRWELGGGKHGGSVELMAASPVTRPRPPTALWLASVFALCGGAGYLIGVAIGAGAASHLHVDTHAHEDSIEIPFSIQLAAAMPRSREDALSALDTHLEYNFDRSAQLVNLRRELARLRGCDDEVRFLVESGQPEDVVAAAASCSTGRPAEVAALVELGRYPEAATRAAGLNLTDVAQARLAAVANVGAGRWAQAAAAYDAVVKTEVGSADAKAVNVVRDKCLAAWFALRGGDAAAKAKLVELAPRGTLCGALAAIESPGPDLGARLEALGHADRPDEIGQSSFANAMGWAYGSMRGMWSWDLAIVGLGEGSPSMEGVFLWELAAASYASTAPRGQFEVALAHAAFDIVRGDLTDAAAQVKLATAAVDAGAYGDPAAVATIQAVIALHLGTQPIAVSKDMPGVDRFVGIRDGDATGDFSLLGASCRLVPAFRSAITSGDAAELVRRLAGCGYIDQFQDSYFLALAPRIKAHGAELVRELNLESPLYTGSRSAIDLIPHAMVRRSIAKLLGDAAGAARWQGILDRQLAMLSDRGRAIAMIALDSSVI